MLRARGRGGGSPQELTNGPANGQVVTQLLPPMADPRHCAPVAEEDLAAELVPAGRDFEVLEVHRVRENHLLQVVVDDLRQLADQLGQPRDLRLVGRLKLLKRQHRQTRRAGLLRQPAEHLPVLEEQVRWPLVRRAELLPEVLLELRDHPADVGLVPADRVGPESCSRNQS